MNSFIKIERIPYEEPHHIELHWEVSNGNVSCKFEYYDNASSLLEIAEALEEFPIHNSSVYLFEIGSEKPEDNFAYYFRFRLFTTNSRGHSAIQIRFCNNLDLPNREITEFCIQAEPADLNRLGNQFREFSKFNENYLVWSEKHSYIGEKNTYA